jgi:5-methyltetrahydrofolate--homocysteine methyltransferase
VGFHSTGYYFRFEYISVATGMEEHRLNALVSLEEQNGFVKIYLMHILVVVSNVSFSFRGNDTVREAMHSVFLIMQFKTE